MKPNQYENFVAQYFEQKGYSVLKTPDTNDYGVDVLAENEDEKIAIQSNIPKSY